MTADDHAIAVVGIGCWFPGARDPRQLWENILARRRQFRRLSDGRMALGDYYDANPSAADKTYVRRAAMIDGFALDWSDLRIPRSSYDSADVAHWLALAVARQALGDAGYTRESVPHERAGVVVGNILTGDTSRCCALRLRWPFVRRVLQSAARGLPPALGEALVARAERQYKAVFPRVTPDSLAGVLANTIAGRICNFFDLHGGGYVVDGACASSLLAVTTAAEHLAARRLDLALAGGVDVSLDPSELIGFAKVGALSHDEIRPFDRRANGFLPGEGCGFVVLKRLDDARAAGDAVYAVLRGWAISSDGRGGMMTPTVSGQALMLRRAYEHAGYSPATLDFVEAHGTATKVGDRTELEALGATLGEHGGRERTCGVTALKSIIGHTKAAAGVGGLIKAVLAVDQRVLPATAQCQQPSEAFATAARALYPVREGVVYDTTRRLRAGVSAMGFGGINAHLAIESGDAATNKWTPALPTRALLASAQESEVFPFAAATHAELATRLRALADEAARLSDGDLVDFAAALAAELPAAPVRAAVVARSADELAAQLTALAELAVGPAATAVRSDAARDLWLGHAASCRIGFLFPGQGAQQLGMARVLVERYPWAQELVAAADGWAEEAGGAAVSPFFLRALDRAGMSEQRAWAHELGRTEVAQPALCLAMLLYRERLRQLGIEAAAVGGHSLGELVAFHAAGAFDAAALMKLATLRGRAMAAGAAAGAMASLACGRDQAAALVDGVAGYVVVAGRNAPRQTVISGEAAAVQAVLERARQRDIVAQRLAVSNAFHSALVEGAAATLRQAAVLPATMAAPALRLCSSMAGVTPAAGLELREHFATQVLAPVDFVELVRDLASACDLLIEVGPGRVLTTLTDEILDGGAPACLPVAARPDADVDFNRVVAAAFAHGADVRWSALYQARLVRPFVPMAERRFVENPCERPLAELPLLTAAEADERAEADAGAEADNATASPSAITGSELTALLIALAAEITGYDAATINAESRLIDDLGLDSIKARELVVGAVSQTGLTAHVDRGKLERAFFTVATLGELAGAIVAAARADGDGEPAPPTWVRDFTVDYAVVPAPAAPSLAGARVLVLAPPAESALAGAIARRMIDAGAQVATADACLANADASIANAEIAVSDGYTHVVAILGHQGEGGRAALEAMAQQLQRVAMLAIAMAPRRACVALVERAPSATDGDEPSAVTAFRGVSSFARSLQAEQPALRVRAVELAAAIDAERAAALVAAELGSDAFFVAVRHDADGARREPRLRLRQPADYAPRALAWSPADVVLVTGGGRGITAECALAFARATGARMVLTGTTPADADSDAAVEVRATLARFAAAGLPACYYACDVSDGAAVTALVARVRAEHGAPSGVIHGAGVNRPRRLDAGRTTDAVAELAPKLLGAAHLMAALADAPPKLLVALTSCIGITGMPGNAWYAFSNQALDGLVGDFGRRHPATSTSCVAYGLWAEVGMGARMGLGAGVAAAGVGLVAKDEGTRRFVTLCLRDPGARQVMVSGALAGLDGWLREPPPRRRRFVEETVRLTAGVELVARARLELEREAYLADHVWRGAALFPAVLAMEAMAQAALAVSGERGVVRMDDVRFARPLSVPARQPVTIELRAEMPERDGDGELVVRVRLSSSHSRFVDEHFTGSVVVGEPPLPPDERAPLSLPAQPLDLDPADLYGDLLFQGPAFQRLRAVYALDSDHAIVACEQRADNEGDWVLGDPFARDASMQAGQLIDPRRLGLPAYIARLELFRAAGDAASPTRIVCVRRRAAAAGDDIGDVLSCDGDGVIRERMSGARAHVVEERRDRPSAEELADPRARAQRPPRAEAATRAPAVVAAAPLYDLDLEGGPARQPVMEERILVSFRDSAQLGRGVLPSSYLFWMGRLREQALLLLCPELRAQLDGGEFGFVTNWAEVKVLGEASAGDFVRARVWCVDAGGSALRMACAFVRALPDGSDEPVAWCEQQVSYVRLTGHGSVAPAEPPQFFTELLARLTPGAGTVAPLAGLAAADRGALVSAVVTPRPPWHEEIATSLEEANYIGNLYYAHYFVWQSRARDRYLHSIAPQYLRSLGLGGELVCRAAHVDYLRDGMPFDRLDVVLSVRALYERGVDFTAEIFRLLPDGRQRLAVGTQEAIWVARPRLGAPPIPRPLPEPLRAALTNGVAERVRGSDGRARL